MCQKYEKTNFHPVDKSSFFVGGEGEIIKKTKKRRKTGRKCEKIEKSAGIIAFFLSGVKISVPKLYLNRTAER